MNQEEKHLIWEHSPTNNYFDNDKTNKMNNVSDDEKYPIRNVKKPHIIEQQADIQSDHQCEKRTSWCLDNNGIDEEDAEQQLRQELIQRATARLRRRLLEQGLQDVMSQVVSLQTQLETLRLDAATTIDTISTLFDNSDNNTVEGSQKMNRQMDVLERRLELHKSTLYQFVSTEKEQQKESKQHSSYHHIAESNMTKSEPTPLTALSMSRLSSLSLVSSIFGRSSNASESSRATSVSDQCFMKEQQYYEDDISNLEDDDCISHIENISGNCFYQQQQQQQQQREEEDHPFYDLAGKRSFKAGSFCGSVYHDNTEEQEQQQKQQLPVPGGNTAEIRWRRRQRRQKHQQHLEQQQQRYMSDDNESLMSDNVSSYSSISSFSNIITPSSRYHQKDSLLYHPLSPVTPPPNYPAGNSFFEHHIRQEEPEFYYKDLTQSWLSSGNFNDCIQQKQWADTIFQKASICPERNVLDEAMSFLDGLSENGDDGGFGEDMYLLLRNPDLCCRPLSEIQSTMHELRQQHHQQQQQQQEQKPTTNQTNLKKYMINMINPAAWCQMGIQFSTDMMYKATCSSLQWCRFLSVLAAAVIISLLKGPEDIRRHSVTSL